MICTPMSEEERARLTALLTSAEKAYHDLMLGGLAVDFSDQNGERIRYTSARKGDLLGYINHIRGLLGLCPFGYAAVSRPAGMIF